MSVLGNSVLQQSFVPAVDVFSGNGATTAFTLSRSVAAVAQVEAFIENVPQSPVDAFTVSGNTITFTSAPPIGSNNIYVRYTSPVTQYVQPTDGSVGLRQLNSDMQGALYGFKNRLINGGMTVDQRNAGGVKTPAADGYLVDRWGTLSNIYTFTAQQNAGGLTGTNLPPGFSNYLGITTTTTASAGATNYTQLAQQVEGVNVADLQWGSAYAQSVTLSFWVRSSATGLMGGTLRNSADNRAYIFSYTINAANTWEYKTIVIPGDTTGTWLTNNGIGISVRFALLMGTSYQGAAGSWGAGGTFAPTGQVNVLANTGATFYITGVQLEKGTTATAFDFREYGEELRRCQRYYEVFYSDPSGQPAVALSYNATNYFYFWYFKQEKRAAPTIAVVNGTWSAAPSSIYGGVSNAQFYKNALFYLTTTAGLAALSASSEL